MQFIHVAAYLDQIKAIQGALWALSTSPGALLLTGTHQPFHLLSCKDRERALLRLASSNLAPLRLIFGSLYGISMLSVYGSPLTGKDGRKFHPLWDVLGYAGSPHIERPLPAADDIWRPSFVNVFSLPTDAQTVTMECDVVVVGSGAGGGVLAAELAKAGFDVVVLEKALYTHPTDLPFTERQSFQLLYERAGAITSEDGSIRTLMGSAWGGGTAVNWSASLIPPGKVREEWAKNYKLPYFVSSHYPEALETVCRRAGISASAVEHNVPNRRFMEGSQRLGYPCAVIPQNTAGKPHKCGYCIFGCPYGEKQGTHMTFLKDAAETGNARFVEGCTVEKVLRKKGHAIGVAGTVKSRNGETVSLNVMAARVVLSAGSLHTPALLLKSGLRNSNIGRNLRLHPCTHVFGIFKEQAEAVKCFSGSIMTVVGTAAENVHGDGYGAKLEISAMHPSMYSTCTPWRGAEDHKRLMSLYDRAVPTLVLSRDSDATKGRISLDKDGNPRLDYSIASKDQKSVLAGVEIAIKTLIAAGADEIVTNQNGVPPFVISKPASADILTSKEFEDYLDRVRAWGYKPTWSPLFSAHQMGTCRLAGTSKLGVCNPEGQTWEVKGLYVADASLFPTASGVNPMVTTLSMGYMVAQSVKSSLISNKL
ncbi:hypothetical protein BC832DRAFT_530553 [Gaertneriomyces semiglobifer]|nr:hypothetical protein BC832DRAFT_530553 [Gaertneriomyces semiglobifer]